jgi:hypothetical protein
VPAEVFESFLDSLRTGSKPAVTTENVDSLFLLANEFFLSELWSECASFSTSAALEAEKREFEEIHCEVERLKTSLRDPQGRHTGPAPPSNPRSSPLPPVSPQRSAVPSVSTHAFSSPHHVLRVEIPIRRDSWNGILWHLTQTLEGADRAEGIVTIRATTYSDCPDPRMNSAKFPKLRCFLRLSRALAYDVSEANLHDDAIDIDLADDTQVVCDITASGSFNMSLTDCLYITWDFHEMRVRLTHYAIMATWLLDWRLDGSVDGESWTCLSWARYQLWGDQFRRTEVCYPVSPPVTCRFIRLHPQAGPFNFYRRMRLSDFEFFGTVFM